MPVLQSRCLHSSRPPYQRISAIAYIAFVILTVGLVALVGLATLRTNALLAEWPTTQNPLLLPGENVLRGLLIALCVGLGLLSFDQGLAIGPRDLIVVGVNFPKGQEAMAVAAVVHKGRLKRWLHTDDLCQVNITL